MGPTDPTTKREIDEFGFVPLTPTFERLDHWAGITVGRYVFSIPGGALEGRDVIRIAALIARRGM